MLGMTGAEILTALLITLGATVLQGWLLRRSVKARPYHANVVRMSAWMRWLAQAMVGIALAVLTVTLFKYRGVDMLAPLVMVGLLGGLGGALLWVGRRWYIEVGDSYVAYNRGIGITRHMRFKAIVKFEDKTINGMPHLRVTAYNGWRVDVPIQALDATPLLAWQAFVQQYQRPPTDEEWSQYLQDRQV